MFFIWSLFSLVFSVILVILYFFIFIWFFVKVDVVFFVRCLLGSFIFVLGIGCLRRSRFWLVLGLGSCRWFFSVYL